MMNKFFQKKIVIVLVFSFTLLSFLQLQAQNSYEELLLDAANAYSKGEYEYSAELYRKIIDQGFASPELFYNIGNAYYKSNKSGLAILYYEKAMLLNPGDNDIHYNLELAKTRIVDKPQEIKQSFVSSAFRDFQNLFSAGIWGRMSVMLFFLLFVAISLFFVFVRPLFKKLSFYSAMILLVLAIVSVVFANNQYKKIIGQKYGIIMTPAVTVKSSPDDNSTNLFVIHEGTKAEVTDNIGDWLEVRLSDGKTGWIKAVVLERI